MTEIKIIEPDQKIWYDTIDFAKSCSWRAGAFLAEKMIRRACDLAREQGFQAAPEIL